MAFGGLDTSRREVVAIATREVASDVACDTGTNVGDLGDRWISIAVDHNVITIPISPQHATSANQSPRLHGKMTIDSVLEWMFESKR